MSKKLGYCTSHLTHCDEHGVIYIATSQGCYKCVKVGERDSPAIASGSAALVTDQGDDGEEEDDQVDDSANKPSGGNRKGK